MYRTASATDNGCILLSDHDVTSASRSMGVLARGANWGCYGPSLVPVLPQPPGGAQHPPAPRRYGPDCQVSRFLIFFRPPNFRRRWADFRETLPHDAVCTEIVDLL